METTTLKLPTPLKSRIAVLAKKRGKSAHSLMVDGLTRFVEREERMRAFVAEALASDRAIERGQSVYAADDVHAWLDQLAAGKKVKPPRAWRK